MSNPFNPPLAWALTAAEIMLGGWVASVGYPVIGGFIMGCAAGAFMARARFADQLRRLVDRPVTDPTDGGGNG
jgi:membrane associated rhomboid family serine protease